jgi:hypothetical protein
MPSTGPVAQLYPCRGEFKTLKEWSRELGLSHACLTSRVRYGIPLDRALHWHPTRERVGPKLTGAVAEWLASPRGAR